MTRRLGSGIIGDMSTHPITHKLICLSDIEPALDDDQSRGWDLWEIGAAADGGDEWVATTDIDEDDEEAAIEWAESEGAVIA